MILIVICYADIHNITPIWSISPNPGFTHLFMFQSEVYFQICRRIEKILVAPFFAGKMQKYRVPHLVSQHKEPFTAGQAGVEIYIHKHCIAVGTGGFQTVIPYRNKFHTHDEAADKRPADKQFLPVVVKLFQADLFALFFSSIGMSYFDIHVFLNSLKSEIVFTIGFSNV